MSLPASLTLRLVHHRWAFAAPLILGAMLLGLGTMARLAMNDPSFALERGYYAKAVRWDEHRAELAESARLGWRSSARWEGGRFELTLVDRSGAALKDARVELTAFPVARSSSPEELTALPDGRGRYHAQPRHPRAGLWELRLVAQVGEARYFSTQRLELSPEVAR